MAAQNRKRITRGELARRTGVNIETIRYFETIGVLAAPERTQGGHRIYDEGYVRTLGFVRRAAIHPMQLSVIREVFEPTVDELERAHEVIDAAAAGESAGNGAVALPDGRFVDEAVVRQARRILARGVKHGS